LLGCWIFFPDAVQFEDSTNVLGYGRN